MVPQRTAHDQHSVCIHEHVHTHMHTEPLGLRWGTSRWGAEAASCLLCDLVRKKHTQRRTIYPRRRAAAALGPDVRTNKSMRSLWAAGPSFRSLVFKCPKSLLEHCCSFDVFSKDEWACHTSPASVRSYLLQVAWGTWCHASLQKENKHSL